MTKEPTKPIGRPRKDDRDKRRINLSISLTQDEYDRIAERAKAERRPVSAMCAILLDKALMQ